MCMCNLILWQIFLVLILIFLFLNKLFRAAISCFSLDHRSQWLPGGSILMPMAFAPVSIILVNQKIWGGGIYKWKGTRNNCHVNNCRNTMWSEIWNPLKKIHSHLFFLVLPAPLIFLKCISLCPFHWYSPPPTPT